MLSLFVVLAGLLVPGAAARAEPILGERRTDATTVTCAMDAGGTTTCAVSQGGAAVCAARTGDTIRRSYRRYDVLRIEGGCTLPVAYWRTHGREGPAPFDDTWEALGAEGGETPFFNAGATYEAVVAADAAAAGEPYDRLAQAYAVAELNRLSGAPTPDAVAAAFEEATVLLLALAPGRLTADEAERAGALAEVLEAYNAGDAGPGTCPDLPEPFSPDDVGETLTGVDSEHEGRIVAVDDRYGRGEGVVELRPRSEDDAFLVPDESFTVGGVPKGEFTVASNDCVDVAAGQQTTVEPGGLPSTPGPRQAALLDLDRRLRIQIALNEAGPPPGAGPTPAAGPAPVAPGSFFGPPGFRPGQSGPGFAVGFPSAFLPAVAGAGGGGNPIFIPDVIGFCQGQAADIITQAGLAFTITVVGTREGATCPVVVATDPPPGTETDAGSMIVLRIEEPVVAIPEAGTLLLFATGLLFIAIVLLPHYGRG